jgi:hypothetical protein
MALEGILGDVTWAILALLAATFLGYRLVGYLRRG